MSLEFQWRHCLLGYYPLPRVTASGCETDCWNGKPPAVQQGRVLDASTHSISRALRKEALVCCTQWKLTSGGRQPLRRPPVRGDCLPWRMTGVRSLVLLWLGAWSKTTLPARPARGLGDGGGGGGGGMSWPVRMTNSLHSYLARHQSQGGWNRPGSETESAEPSQCWNGKPLAVWVWTR